MAKPGPTVIGDGSELITEDRTSHQPDFVALTRPMRLLFSLPGVPIRTIEAAEIAGFVEAWDIRKMSKMMSVLHGRSLVKRVGVGMYQITGPGLKVQARLKRQVYGIPE